MEAQTLPTHEPLLRVMSLHSLAYCPRLFYFEEVEEIRRADEAVHDGRRLHEELDEGALTSYTLEAPLLGLRGKVDAIRKRDGQLIPIEVKKGRCARGEGPEAAWPGDRIQVAAYALLLEETQGVAITEGRVRYLESGRTVRLPIDEGLRQQVRAAIAEARALRRQVHRPPVTDNERRCPKCSLAPICLPEEERRARNPEHAPLRLFPPHQDRTIVHVLEHGAQVGRKAERLAVRFRPGAPEQSFAIHQVESVVIHGYGQISSQALRLCADNDISVFWMTGAGEVVTACVAPALSAQRHIRQFKALSEDGAKLPLAKLLMVAKIDAQLHFLMRGLRGSDHPDAQELLARVRRGVRDAEAAESIDSLLGIEGAAASAYFQGLSLLIKPEVDERLHYVRRSRPAADRFSAALNFLYGMLRRQVRASILAVGLHPGVGFYHQLRSAAPPLVLDLMELFRVPMADMPLVAAINRGTFHPDKDFEVAGSHVSLSQEGRAKAIEIFERRKGEEWRHPVIGYSLSYERSVELEVRLLEKHFSGEGKLFAQSRLR